MLRGTSVLASLPTSEVAGFGLGGSLLAPEQVLAGPISNDFRCALLLIDAQCRRRGVALTCLVRPEIFTHGESQRWLKERVGDVEHHICISDGTVVKHIPGCATHVFLYRRAHHESHAAFQRLSRRAPELLAQVEGQVNTWFTFGSLGRRSRPTPILWAAAGRYHHPPCTFWPFWVARHSAEESVRRIREFGPQPADGLVTYDQALYIPLTETALHDRDFAHALAELVHRAFFDVGHLLILRLPAAGVDADPLAHGMTALVRALAGSGIVIPPISPPNVVITTEDLEEDHPLVQRMTYRVMVHESFDFWRYSADFYSHADRISVMTGLDEVAGGFSYLPSDVTEVYGPRAVRRWLHASANG